jgi:small subunit ribosomal protein S4
MKLGPKYKIARRLGGSVFEKTQGPKFALNEQKRSRNRRMSRPRSTFGKQLIEKQKVRFTYLLTEKQFAKYIKAAIASKSASQSEFLYQQLELRVDNIALRAGFLKTRPLAKQAVSHGHFTLNGKRIDIPSIQLKKGDKLVIREASRTKGLFADLENTIKEAPQCAWLKVNIKDFSIEVTGEPTYNKTESHFDLQQVLEFYKR